MRDIVHTYLGIFMAVAVATELLWLSMGGEAIVSECCRVPGVAGLPVSGDC